MILDSLVILIMKNVNIARLYFLYGGLYWNILAKTIVWYLSVSKWRIFKMKLKNKLAGYLEYCKFRKELDEKTLKAYRIDLKQYFNFVSCDEPDKEKIEEYITELHKKYKQKTVKRKIATLKAYYNYLEEEEIINDNPFRRIKVKFKENVTLPRIIPREEIEQLLNFMYNRLDENDNSVYKYRLSANSARTVRLFRNRRYIHSDLVVRVFCSKRYVFPLLL